MVCGDVTAPVPKLVHVRPESIDHSYDSMAAPPLSPGVKKIDMVVVVTSIDVIVGADGVMAEITNSTETLEAARKLVVSSDEAVSLHVPAKTMVTESPLTVQTLVVSLTTTTVVPVSSAVVVGATLKDSRA